MASKNPYQVVSYAQGVGHCVHGFGVELDWSYSASPFGAKMLAAQLNSAYHRGALDERKRARQRARKAGK